MDSSGQKMRSKSESGQAIVEYMLMLVIVVSIAYIIIGAMIGQNRQPGVVIRTWSGILGVIAADNPDHPN